MAHLDIILLGHHDDLVRTTVTLDDGIFEKIRKIAHLRNSSFKDVLNAALRRGLTVQETASNVRQPFRVEAFQSPFRAGVDPFRLNQLADELEARRAKR